MVRFLLDEDTKAELATHLEKDGHETTRVVTTEGLGRGSSDGAVMAHARKSERIILTHDDDYVDPGLADEHAGTSTSRVSATTRSTSSPSSVRSSTPHRRRNCHRSSSSPPSGSEDEFDTPA